MIYHPRQHRILVQVDQMWYSLNLFLFFTLLSSWRITLRHLDLLRTKHKSFWVRYRVLEKGTRTTEGPSKVVWGHLGMWFAIRSLKQVIKKSFLLACFCDWENENDIHDQRFAFFHLWTEPEIPLYDSLYCGLIIEDWGSLTYSTDWEDKVSKSYIYTSRSLYLFIPAHHALSIKLHLCKELLFHFFSHFLFLFVTWTRVITVLIIDLKRRDVYKNSIQAY